MRSRAAAATLSGSGYQEVYSMEGGIKAWKGLVAAGPPESGLAYFSPAARAEELIALAWLLEDGTRQFYTQMVEREKDAEADRLYKELIIAEEGHQGSLLNLYKEISGTSSDPGFPRSIISEENGGPVLEGGIRLDDALQWAQGKPVEEILEFSVSMETNSYDLYIKMERQAKDPRSAKVFRVLSAEEKKHLERLSALLEKKI